MDGCTLNIGDVKVRNIEKLILITPMCYIKYLHKQKGFYWHHIGEIVNINIPTLKSNPTEVPMVSISLNWAHLATNTLVDDGKNVRFSVFLS